MIKLFAKEYNEMKGDGMSLSLSLSLGSVLPMPDTQKRSDYLMVPFWVKEEFTCYLKDAKKGETDGDATWKSVEPAAKRGCPTDNNTPDDSKSNKFLHNTDGTQISKGCLRYLGVKARRAWLSLQKKGLVPPTFMQITKQAWEYYM
jgi:hypothetical protein